jgi:probable H4MPT-linked C1 transfer pathway protein
MTGELSDVFSDRAEGVAYLVDMMRTASGGEALFYGGRAGFLDCIRAVERSPDVASANWHASATLIAQVFPDGLFVDVGTTTTDLIPLKEGAVAARGFTDGERLAESELVYTGVVRTPVMAVARTAPFRARAAHRCRALCHHGRRLAAVGRVAPDADPTRPPISRAKARKRAPRGLPACSAVTPAMGPSCLADLARHFAECQLAEIEAAALTLTRAKRSRRTHR